MSRETNAADYGLVGTVGGLAVMLVLSMLTIGVSAFSGGVPLVLVVLLGGATFVTAVSAIVLMVARRSVGRQSPGP